MAAFNRAMTRAAAAIAATHGAGLLRCHRCSWDPAKNEKGGEQSGQSIFQHALHTNTRSGSLQGEARTPGYSTGTLCCILAALSSGD